MAQKLQTIPLVRLKLAFLSVVGFVALLTGSAEARSFRTPLCVSFSQMAGAGQEFGSSLGGVKTLTNSEKKVIQDPKARDSEIKAWYDLVRVSRQSVLVQIEF